MRWYRKGFAVRTGFRDVKEGSALLAQAIDRRKKTLQRFSRFAGGFAVAVGCPALVERLIGRDFFEREQQDERIQKLQCRAALDFCSRTTSLEMRAPAASEGEIRTGQQLGRRNNMNELRSILLAADNPEPD